MDLQKHDASAAYVWWRMYRGIKTKVHHSHHVFDASTIN